MASIPGAMYRAGKIHDDMNKFRKRSASDAENSRSSLEKLKTDVNYRVRSVSVTTAPTALDISPSPSPSSPGALSPAVSGDSIKTFVSGFIGGVFPWEFPNIGSKKNATCTSMESVGEESQTMSMRGFPTAGSITDLVSMK